MCVCVCVFVCVCVCVIILYCAMLDASQCESVEIPVAMISVQGMILSKLMGDLCVVDTFIYMYMYHVYSSVTVQEY